MQKIRQLAQSIFFKIFMGFLVLSFAFFGVSNFLLNGSGTWVAKVDGKAISYNQLQKAMQADRDAIMRANSTNPQALQYIESNQFKSDVLGRLVNRVIIEKLRDHFGVQASRTIILEAVAKDPQFNKDGKFDHEAFKKFLAQNGFDEDRYVKAVQDEIVGTMIISSVSLASPVDNKLVAQIADLKSQKRFADVILVTDKNLGAIEPATDKELEQFYEKHKEKFAQKEMRKISYLVISKKDLGKVSDDEATKKVSQIEDSLLASNSLEETAKKFNLNVVFTSELDLEGRDVKGGEAVHAKILEDFTKNAFALKENEVSKLYHSKSNDVFYTIKVEKISAARTRTFEEVKFLITDLYAKEQRVLKLKELAQNIADEIKKDTANVTQIAKKHNLKIENNKEFPRFYYINFQGQNIPYSNQFNEELFSLQVNQATNAAQVSPTEFKIGILKHIKQNPSSAAQTEHAKVELSKEYKTEILQEFNKFLQKKFPIKVNEKFLGQLEKEPK